MSCSNKTDLPVVEIKNVSKCFPVRLNSLRLLGYLMPWEKQPQEEDFWALQDVDFTLNRGEVVGLVGQNGSGKSTLLQIVAGLMNPSSGSVTVRGRISALLELGAGFNPEFTGRENIYLSAAIYGLSKKAIEDRFDGIVDFADIGAHLEQPVKTYSSGMFARLAFAVSIQVDPDIILVDEILSVGDISFQSKCFQKIEELRDQGSSIIMVSHDMNSVRMFCDKAYLLNDGRIVCDGNPSDVTDRYLMLMMEARDSKEQSGKMNTLPIKYKKAFITDVCLLDSEGNSVLKPYSGGQYQVNYTVEFNKQVESPIVTVQFKTLMGLVVADVSSAFQANKIPSCKAGDKLLVSMPFALNMCPGPYRLGVSVAERVSTGDVPVFGVDNMTLEVIARDKTEAFGIVDIDSNLSFEHVASKTH